MMQPVVVIGAGGFGRETLDVIEAANRQTTQPLFTVVGVVDDSPSVAALARLATRGTRWLGTIDEWLAREGSELYLIGIGSPSVRAAIDARLGAAGRFAASVIHPNATIGSMCAIGPGAIICSGAEISTNVAIGRNVHINPNATVGHDAVISDCVSINPSATVSGEVSIGRQTLVGAAAVILQGLSLGREVVVGASACVVNDVSAGRTVVGVPAR
jgi:sugar O-acyltransferase (sialic acid O-acetyltransferase NeuD family)